jgi:hypothetical protein
MANDEIPLPLPDIQLVSAPLASRFRLMERRHFLRNSLVTAAVGGGTLAAESADAAAVRPSDEREFYELRTYTVKDDTQRQLVNDYLEKAFIPAMNRLGSTPIGVFTEQKPNDLIWVLIPYASLDQFLTVSEKLLSDPEHLKAGADYLNIKAPDKAYERINSSLLRAFPGMPKLEQPAQAKEKKSRILQLRIYASHSEIAGRTKIEMFHQGEIDIFKRVGLTPVFFSESLVGSNRPNLTYMLVFDDKPALDKAWKTFIQDPAWTKLKSTPGFADKEIVSGITNMPMNPAPYSQI